MPRQLVRVRVRVSVRVRLRVRVRLGLALGCDDIPLTRIQTGRVS